MAMRGDIILAGGTVLEGVWLEHNPDMTVMKIWLGGECPYRYGPNGPWSTRPADFTVGPLGWIAWRGGDYLRFD